MKHVPVLIAGGGPVGMTLARTLASFGVRCLLVERQPSTTRHPKMDITNGRSMELFRRIGLADKLRAVAVPEENNFDVSWITSLTGPRTAPLPLSQRGREAGRDPREERRHPAARAGHAGEPGDDRAGAAATPSSTIRWSTRAGAWRSRISRQDETGVTVHAARGRDGRDRDGALRLPRRLRRRLVDRAREARHRAARARPTWRIAT